MKKLIAAVLIFVLVLTACSNDIPNEHRDDLISEKPQEEQMEPEEPQEKPKEEQEQTEENEIPLEAEFLGELGGEKLFAVEVSKETRPHRFFDEDGRQYLKDTEITIYDIIDAAGNKILPHPVDDHYFSELGDMGNDDEYLLFCTYNGDRYEYKQENGYTLKLHKKGGPTGEYLNGFEITEYYYEEVYMHGRGLNNPDGSVFIEPIFLRIEAPFEDRFMLLYGTSPQAIECTGTEIIDLEGNLICDNYSYVHYYHLDDGSYIGVAHCMQGEVMCRDENGKLYEEGCWLVDKNGNKVSEKYESAMINRAVGRNEIFTPEEIFTIQTLDGETIEVPMKEIAIKP